MEELTGTERRARHVRNRMWLEGPDVLVIRSEAEPEGGALVTLGEWRFRRIRTAPDGGADTTAVPVRR